jgi:hypothetical protein
MSTIKQLRAEQARLVHDLARRRGISYAEAERQLRVEAGLGGRAPLDSAGMRATLKVAQRHSMKFADCLHYSREAGDPAVGPVAARLHETGRVPPTASTLTTTYTDGSTKVEKLAGTVAVSTARTISGPEMRKLRQELDRRRRNGEPELTWLEILDAYLERSPTARLDRGGRIETEDDARRDSGFGERRG